MRDIRSDTARARPLRKWFAGASGLTKRKSASINGTQVRGLTIVTIEPVSVGRIKKQQQGSGPSTDQARCVE